jgi:hypothetical protein
MNCDNKPKGHWMMIVVIIAQAIIMLSLIVKCINFKTEMCNRQMCIRMCASGAQEIVDELIKLQAIDELAHFNSELPMEFMNANQNRLSPDFWNKWGMRVRVLKDNCSPE